MSFSDMILDFATFQPNERIAVTGYYQTASGNDYLVPSPDRFRARVFLQIDNAPRGARKTLLDCISTPGMRSCGGTFLVHTGCETVDSLDRPTSTPCLILDDVFSSLPD